MLAAMAATINVQSAAAKEIKLYGLNYSSRKGPDWDPEKCKSRAAIKADLQLLKSLTNRIRIYSLTDCDQGRTILALAKELEMQVWLGMWVGKEPDAFEGELTELKSMIDDNLIVPSDIIAIHVGSEAIYRKDVTAAEAIDNMETVKMILTEAQLSDIPVSIADIGDIYEETPALTAAVDVVSANNFPFWEKKTAEEAAAYLITRSAKVIADAGSKPFYLGETGWSSSGKNENASIASPANQATYFETFYCQVDVKSNWRYFYFTGLDDEWRTQQEGEKDTVEGHFGIFHVNRTMKSWFKNMKFTCDDGQEFAMQAIAPTLDDSSTSSSSSILLPSISFVVVSLFFN